jgi:transglutaminase-like putative cysteine protease/pimeloyl-ACP methyl ester carboxylesterase
MMLALFQAILFLLPAQAQETTTERWWSDAIENILKQAGTNRSQLVTALQQTPADQHSGMQFLLQNMPQRDLESLSARFLCENVSLAYAAAAQVPWAKNIPEEIFLNDVLPYASVSEQRDNWRKRLHEICLPLVKDSTTPAAAAQLINQKLFDGLKVKYSTQRRIPDQGPFETMETGVATCTGLSILLVDACRSVGIPARVVGTPLWANNSGNHTWVEIWDGGWHFAGAAEADPAGLDRGWFVHNASEAVKNIPEHSIYASSFKRTGLRFPLSWAPRIDYVSAVNVTDRYAAKAKPADTGKVRVNIQVFDRPVGERVVAKVTAADAANSASRFEGSSKGPSADGNDHLFFELPAQRTFIIESELDGKKRRQYYTTGTEGEDLLKVYMAGVPDAPAIPQMCYAPPAVEKPLAAKDEAKLKAELTGFFNASTNRQALWEFPSSLEKLLRNNEPATRRAAWEAFLAATNNGSLWPSFAEKKVRFGEHVSPYTVKTVGTRPPNGWGLFIAMHGGGGAPQELNDSQWKQMQHYYRDHPEAGGYIYLALRAPDNTWNGFYTGYAYPLVENLVRQFLLFGDVDPNKVFLMGYSHGGYGAFAIGPKMPDRFAAIHASAAALADGAVADTLRNTVFTCMVGGKDTAYGRIERCQEFKVEIQRLRGDRQDIFPVTVQIIADHPHSGLPDRDSIAEMYPARRNPVPPELTWVLTDKVITDFFWLRVPQPTPGARFDVTCQNNTLTAATTTNLTTATILLDERLVDFAKPVTLVLNGKTTTHKLKPSLRKLCETLVRRGDPELAFTAEISLPVSSRN